MRLIKIERKYIQKLEYLHKDLSSKWIPTNKFHKSKHLPFQYTLHFSELQVQPKLQFRTRSLLFGHVQSPLIIQNLIFWLWNSGFGKSIKLRKWTIRYFWSWKVKSRKESQPILLYLPIDCGILSPCVESQVLIGGGIACPRQYQEQSFLLTSTWEKRNPYVKVYITPHVSCILW